MSLIIALDYCPCENLRCVRRGNCEACLERHKTHESKPLPWCQRAENQEKLKKLIEEYEKKQAQN